MGYEEDVTVLALKKERVREGEFFWEARHGLTTLDMDCHSIMNDAILIFVRT